MAKVKPSKTTRHLVRERAIRLEQEARIRELEQQLNNSRSQGSETKPRPRPSMKKRRARRLRLQQQQHEEDRLSWSPSPSPHLPPPVIRAQPTGDVCLVISRSSSRQGLFSTTTRGPDGRSHKHQHQIPERTQRLRQENLELGRRLATNAPQPHVFQRIETTHHNKSGTMLLAWTKAAGNVGDMVKDVRRIIQSVGQEQRLTIMCRGLDALQVIQDSYREFVKLLKPGTQVIWQYSSVKRSTAHPRLQGYRGLGAVLAFDLQELVDHFNGRVHSPDVARLEEIWHDLLINKRMGLGRFNYGRNDFPDEDFEWQGEIAPE